MPVKSKTRNLQRDTLRLIAATNSGTVKGRIAELGALYSEENKLLTGTLNKLKNQYRIYPRHLPTQASGRWSTVDPPITNWPRRCINPHCPQTEHEWDTNCWSVRDIIKADPGWTLVVWDHDNIEGRIHDIIVNDKMAIQAHKEGFDLHTITCCDIFQYTYPSDLRNPHSSEVDTEWRAQYHWQGKDTKQRVLAKNFNHGSKYSESWTFVKQIKGLEQYGVSAQHMKELALAYIASKAEPWATKLAIMNKIKRERIARSLYGFRRVFFTSDSETGREGFSHMISGTVSDYNDESLLMLEAMLGDACYISNNAHDGNKFFIRTDSLPSIPELKKVLERDVSYQGRSITLTVGVKIYA